MFSNDSEYSASNSTSVITQNDVTKKIQNYSKFDPRKYVQEYYSTIGEENKFLMEFYHQIYKEVSTEATLLEFGGGPTIYQLLSAAQKVKEIVFAEYLESNRKEIDAWINNEKDAVDWTQYLDHVLNLDCKLINDHNRDSLRQILAFKLSGIIECDAYSPYVLKGYEQKQFDIVSSSFCLECISSSELEFVCFVEKVFALVKQGGMLVLTLLKNSEYYKINDLIFPTFPIDEDYITELLQNLGFRNLQIQSLEAEDEQGYEGIIALTASR